MTANYTALRKMLTRYQNRVETVLDKWLPAETTHPEILHKAMRYGALSGGKRVRPVLTYCAGEVLGIPLEQLDGPACALELIHCYSLIHDDLPAMDDDDLRRGKPTCHKVFGEAMALLAGDAMQVLAFHILAHDPAMTSDAAARLKMVDTLAIASGSKGMAGGQAVDLDSVGSTLDLAQLEFMHILKTGALIRASVQMAEINAVGYSQEQLDKLGHYAKCVGLAFQIRDDVLDIEGETETIGKPQGSDEALNKPTYPAILGVSGAKARARELHEEAIAALAQFDERADPLRWLSAYIVERAY
jgi:farnesyl diphosphate synthase